jgi:hypothetical protein
VPTELNKQHPDSRRGEQLALPIDPWSAPAIAEIVFCSICGREIVVVDRRGKSEYRDGSGRCFSCSNEARRAGR